MSDMDQNKSTVDKLPINDLLVDAFKMVWEERRDFVAMAALPIIGLALVAAVTHVYFPGNIVEYNEEGLPVSLNSGVFINIAFMLIFALANGLSFSDRSDEGARPAGMPVRARQVAFTLIEQSPIACVLTGFEGNGLFMNDAFRACLIFPNRAR